ncbi:MAG: DUF1311 domain-containing protein [Proteobacteria bacterium]|nr:DUF1311 domain-containing protein [Pseudomonadota bacterium]
MYENIITIIDIISTCAFGVALLFAVRIPRSIMDQPSKTFLALSLGIYVFVGLSNILEHGQITDYLDRYEDYVEIFFPLFFLYFIYSVITRQELNNREQAEKALRKTLKEREELERKQRELEDKLRELEALQRQRDIPAPPSQYSPPPAASRNIDPSFLFRSDAIPSFDCFEYSQKPRGHKHRIPQSDILCIDVDAAAWDRRMGDAYRAYRNRFNKSGRRQLVKRQLAWIARRNATCPASWSDVTDDNARAAVANCMIQVTRQRTEELQ